MTGQVDSITKLITDYRRAWSIMDLESIVAIGTRIPTDERPRARRRTDAVIPYTGWPDKVQPLGCIDDWSWAPQPEPRKRGKVGRRPKRKRATFVFQSPAGKSVKGTHPVEERMATKKEHAAFWATIPQRPGAMEPPDDEGDRIRIAQLCGKSGLRHTAVDRGPISG